jgi:hypothetical protein
LQDSCYEPVGNDQQVQVSELSEEKNEKNTLTTSDQSEAHAENMQQIRQKESDNDEKQHHCLFGMKAKGYRGERRKTRVNGISF